MKWIISIFLVLNYFAFPQSINYPLTKKEDVKDNYFGTIIEDPYRWLEDDNSEETKKWVNEQNKITQDYLSKINFREKIKTRLTELLNYPRYSAPSKVGNSYIFFKNDGLQNQSVLYFQETLNSEPVVLLDPNKLSEDGTIALSATSPSQDGKYLAYSISKSGSDWQEAYVIEIKTKLKLKDKIQWMKFSGLSWYKDGFFYSRYDEPSEENKLKASNEYHKVYYHKIGTDQKEDKLIFSDSSHPKRNFYAIVTEDEKFLALYLSESASGKNALYIKRLSDNSDFLKLIDNFENDYALEDNDGDNLIITTTEGAPNKKIILVDFNHPEKSNWKVLIPEKKEVLQNAFLIQNKLILTYLKDASSHTYIYNLNGKMESEIKFPTLGSVGGFSGKRNDKECFYTFSSFTYPPVIFKFNIETKKSEIFRIPEIKFDLNNYITKQVFFKSKDGVKVPMFIVHKKNIKYDGKNPTHIYGYGGFNAALTPNFSATRLLFLEKGGIYVSVNLRGGSEYGEKWHQDGMLFKKQNVFNDFIAATEYLIKNKYTSPDKIIISGGSNGGTLIGAVINQRPDLYKVAIPSVGVMDMLRYHKFTIGWSWVGEYGSSDDSTQFKNLLSYSPLHNIKSNLNYPAVMITTADHDDRVVPAHSFKYAATLQEKYKGNNPILIRIESKAGHGGGKPISKIIDEQADIWSFIFYNLGIKY